MGRLKALPPRISTLAPRLGHAQGDERAVDRKREQAQDWRSWYRTKRWADLRRFVFVRDRYVCQRSGALAIGKHPAPNSPVANHKRPHRGDPVLFWDPENIETVTKEVHDGLIQKDEQSIIQGMWD